LGKESAMFRRLVLFAFLFWFVPSYAQAPLPDVAWTSTSGALWLAGWGMEPVQIASAGACCAVWSPGGTRLAYVVDDGQTLNILDAASRTTQRIPRDMLPDGSLLGFIHWQDDHTLWLNTLQNPQLRGGSLLESNWDLWQVDIENQRINKFPTQGIAYPAPASDHVLIVDPGHYQEQEAVARLYNTAGDLLHHFDYAATSSGSHLSQAPHVQWVGDAVHVVVPAPDLLYNPDQMSRLVRMTPQAGAETQGEINVVFPAQAFWSPTAEQIAYINPQAALIVRNLADGTEQTIADGLPIGTVILGWRDALLFNVPDKGLHFWSVEAGIEALVPDVLGVSYAQTGELILLKLDAVVMLQNNIEVPLAQNISGFDLFLAGR